MIRNYMDLTRLEMEQVDRKNTLVLIPCGAIEQHGNQAPLGTDTIIANDMCRYLREELPEDLDMLVFPVLPVGLSIEHMKFCGSITLEPDTYYHVLFDICMSLSTHWFRKVVFLICHGGNTAVIQLMSRRLRAKTDLYPFYLSSGAFSNPKVQATISKGNTFDFHGGEMETSMVMANHPQLVHLEEAKAGHNNGLFFSGAGIGWMGEDWIDDEGKPIGIGGDPSGATAEKGEIILRESAKELVPKLLAIRDYRIPE